MSCRCLCSTCINRGQWKYHDSFLSCVLTLEAFAFHHGVVAFVRFVQNSENTDESSHVTDDIFALPVRRPTTASRFVLSMCTSTRIDVHENDYEYDDLCLSICTHYFVVNAFSSRFPPSTHYKVTVTSKNAPSSSTNTTNTLSPTYTISSGIPIELARIETFFASRRCNKMA